MINLNEIACFDYIIVGSAKVRLCVAQTSRFQIDLSGIRFDPDSRYYLSSNQEKEVLSWDLPHFDDEPKNIRIYGIVPFVLYYYHIKDNNGNYSGLVG